MKKVISVIMIIFIAAGVMALNTVALSEEEVSEIFKEACSMAEVWNGLGHRYYEDHVTVYETQIPDPEYKGTKWDYTDLTKEDARNILKKRFSDEIIDGFFANENYNGMTWIEYEGKLLFDAGQGVDTCEEGFKRSFKITKRTDGTIVYSMDIQTKNAYYGSLEDGYVERPEDTVHYDYVLEKDENGNYIFTSFVMPYLVEYLPENKTAAANIDAKDGELIDRAIRICGLIQDGDHDEYYLDGDDPRKFIRDEYTGTQDQGNYVRLSEDFRTEAQMLQHYKTVFSDEIAQDLIHTDTLWLKNIDGQIIFLYDAKLMKDYKLDGNTPIEILSQNSEKTVYKLVFGHYQGTSPVVYEDKTIVTENTKDGRRITGGTFVDDILLPQRPPETADGPVYIIAAAALISLSGIVLTRKKQIGRRG